MARTRHRTLAHERRVDGLDGEWHQELLSVLLITYILALEDAPWPTSVSSPPIHYFMGSTRTVTPLIGGKLYTYQAGTSTPAAAYHDAAATMPHQNPIMLDDRGEALVHITQAMLWKLRNADGRPAVGRR